VAPSESGRVHLFATCLADAFFPESALAAAEVLEHAGFQVDYDDRQTCCGQPAMNLGHLEEARRLARRTMRLYAEDDGPIVVPSGSCSAMMALHYPGLFPEGSKENEQVQGFARRVVEWSRFLVEAGYKPPRSPGMLPKVTVHPSCHGLRELGIRDEPVRLLEAAGYPLVGLPGADECCGFGGAFSVVLPEMSGAVLRAKLANVERAQGDGAQVVASLDAGCVMHMRGGHERAAGCLEGEGKCPRYRHVAQLVAAVVRGKGQGGGRDDASPS
jgi:L-lactate dehydrogenase complex protein LldE